MNSLDIKFYFTIFKRWLPFLLVVWSLITGLSVTVALLLPPVYRATASILVESQQISEALARSTVEVSSLEQMQVLQQQLMTRTNLLEIAKEFEIFKSEPSLSPTDIVDRMASATFFDQSEYGSTRNNTGAIIFDISFEANDASLAARVTNQLATLILEQNVKIRTGRASETMQFFQNSVNELGAQLAKYESEILDFKNANEDALPDSLTFRRDQITILQERLLQLERDETALVEAKDTLELTLQTMDGETALELQTTPNQQNLAAMRSELSDQSAIYSDTNPKIVSLKSRITALEKLVREEESNLVIINGDAAPSTLSGRLEQIVSRLSTVQAQRIGIDGQIKSLGESISRTPANEVKLNTLERNYDNIKIQFTDAQQKLSEAATGEQLELRQKGERFEMIEQPSVPDAPIRPNRKIIGVAGSAAGLALGFMIGLIFEFLNTSIRRPGDLFKSLEITPFATIPYVETRGEIVRSRLITSGWILAFAGGIPSALYLVHYHYVPLDLLLQNLSDKTGLSGLLAKLSG